MKKWLSNIIAMLLSTLIMLLVCEGIVRLVKPQQLAPVKFMYDKEIGLIHIPNLRGTEYRPGNYNIEFTNGDDGFRITHKDELPDYVNKKIMFIGDSFTYGKGVNDQETFAYKLQQALISDSVEIINAGVEGRGTDHALRSYQFYKDKYQPNTVIYFAHYNDLADNIRDEYFNVINDSTLTPKSFEIMIRDINEAPTLTSPAHVDVPENTTSVQTVTATDVDAGTTLAYSLTGGADLSKFSINGSTGALIFMSAPDF